jgi:ABC-type multidrug transport system ATPase subunit
MTTGVETILELVGITKSYQGDLSFKKRRVVDNLNLKFAANSCTALMGHNGAGKTSTIKMILGLVYPDHGKVIFRGQPLRIKDKAQIGYMPETNKLPLNFTCEELLTNQLKLYRPAGIKSSQIKKLVHERLDEVGLLQRRASRIKHLSKGMGRRLAWAQAIIHNPSLVILDEPFQGLDPQGRHDLSQWIGQKKAEGKSLIISTHDFSTVFDLCDHIYIMKGGKLVFSTYNDTSRDPSKLRYHLSLTGANEQDLRYLIQKENLPEWSKIERSGYLTKMEFTEYTSAANWLQACLSKGYVVVNFTETNLIDKDSLYPYFVGG